MNQTISGLAQGRPIRGNVAFLGGPLHFMPELQKAFVRTLKLTPEQTIVPENSHLFAAMGSVQYAAANLPEQMTSFPLNELCEKLEKGIHLEAEIKRLPPLFQDEAEYNRFVERHAYYKIKRADLATASGKCYLGIDARFHPPPNWRLSTPMATCSGPSMRAMWAVRSIRSSRP